MSYLPQCGQYCVVFLGSNLPASCCEDAAERRKGFLLDVLYCSAAIISSSVEHSEAMNYADKIIE